MREVEVSRFVQASEPEVRQALTPESMLGYEASFEVGHVEEEPDGVVVTAVGRGLELDLVFDPDADGLAYEQRGTAGPFEEMWTTVALQRENEGVRVTARSGVSLGLPIPGVSDRIAAWKRRGELDRGLRRLAEAVE